MLDLAHRYPEMPAAPRALLASSVIYWHQVQDGASVPSPDRLARHLPALDSVEIDRTTPERGPDTTAAARPSSESPSAAPDTDTTGVAAPPTDTTAAPESQAGRADLLTSDDVPQDSADAAERKRASAPEPPAAQSEGGVPTRTVGPHWMVVFASLEPDTMVQQSVRQYRRRWADTDVPIRLCREEERVRVGIGPFAIEEEAQAARALWADRLPAEAWMHSCDRAAPNVRLADTTRFRDSTATPSPSPRGGERYAPLEALLTYLMQQYPDAPQTARAKTIMEVVQERRREADSLAATPTPNQEKRAGSALDSVQASPQASQSPPEATSSRSVPRRSEGSGTDTTMAPRRSPEPDTTGTDSSSVAPRSRPDDK
jgi:hypothetical protein